jgi:hypothetical protein
MIVLCFHWHERSGSRVKHNLIGSEPLSMYFIFCPRPPPGALSIGMPRAFFLIWVRHMGSKFLMPVEPYSTHGCRYCVPAGAGKPTIFHGFDAPIYERIARAPDQYRFWRRRTTENSCLLPRKPWNRARITAAHPFDSPAIARRRSLRRSASGPVRGGMRANWWQQSKGFSRVMGLSRTAESTKRRLTSWTRRSAYGFANWN